MKLMPIILPLNTSIPRGTHGADDFLITIFWIYYVVVSVVGVVNLLKEYQSDIVRGRDFLFAAFVLPIYLPFKVIFWIIRNF